jgi:hypothetical protein
MGSSVSSERAFSAAGQTITKRRNRLKGDIVEALQTLKSAYRQDLLVHEPEPSSALELQLEEEEEREESLTKEVIAESLKAKPSVSSFLLDLELEDDDDEDIYDGL